jgi:hypothetical protein
MSHLEHDGHIVRTGSIVKETFAKRLVAGAFSLIPITKPSSGKVQ